ncbi:hypothetical protein Tco_0088795 [Tanacetum coccineum]
MTTTVAQQVALDNALVAPADRMSHKSICSGSGTPSTSMIHPTGSRLARKGSLLICIMRFVSKSEYFQVYGALLSQAMTNQKMRDYTAYKTYLAYATGAATPKKARKFKKPASPSKKSTFVTVEDEEPEPAKKKVSSKKSSRKQPVGVVIRDAPVMSMKKALKRSKLETSIHQAGSSGDGTGSQPGVPDKPKVKSTDTYEGTSLIPGVPNVSQIVHSDSENESWGNSGDEANVQVNEEETQESDDDLQHADDERTPFENQKTNDDEEETEDKFVHTPEDYVPTNDETNDETNDVDEEEYDRIDEELYGDVNIILIDAKQDADEEGDAIIAYTI